MRRDHRPGGWESSTVIDFDGEAVWGPLETVAALARQSPHLPSFHPFEFMFIGTARDRMSGLAIHLYKHIDTRRYLNRDDAGHAYAYGAGRSMKETGVSGGCYSPHRSLADAIEQLDLSLFETEPGCIRSFPSDGWPADGACGA